MIAPYVPRPALYISSLFMGTGTISVLMFAHGVASERAFIAWGLGVALLGGTMLLCCANTLLAVLDLRMDVRPTPSERRFWMVSIVLSLGLLVPLRWLRSHIWPEGRAPKPTFADTNRTPIPVKRASPTTATPAPAVAPTVPPPPAPEQVLQPIRPETAPTLLVDPSYPLAARTPADLSFIRHSLKRTHHGTLAPSRQIRLRPKRAARSIAPDHPLR